MGSRGEYRYAEKIDVRRVECLLNTIQPLSILSYFKVLEDELAAKILQRESGTYINSPYDDAITFLLFMRITRSWRLQGHRKVATYRLGRSCLLGPSESWFSKPVHFSIWVTANNAEKDLCDVISSIALNHKTKRLNYTVHRLHLIVANKSQSLDLYDHYNLLLAMFTTHDFVTHITRYDITSALNNQKDLFDYFLSSNQTINRRQSPNPFRSCHLLSLLWSLIKPLTWQRLFYYHLETIPVTRFNSILSNQRVWSTEDCQW